MAEPIRFYFDFVSSYSYPVMTRIDDVGARTDRAVDWIAVSLPEVFKERNAVSPRQQPAKFAHNQNDLKRLCAMWGIPWTPQPGPLDGTLPRLAFWRLKARDAKLARDFAEAADRAWFGHAHDTSTPAGLAAACRDAGLAIDEADLAAALDDDGAKAALEAAQLQAIADGMFGAPFMVADGETFWGADRLSHLEWRLSGSRQPDPPEGFQPFWLNGGFIGHTGPLWIKAEGRHATFAFRVMPHHANPRGSTHGGMLMTFMDVALAQSVLYEHGIRGMIATIKFECDFVAPAMPGDWVTSDYEIVRETRNMVFINGRAKVGADTVMRCSAIYKTPRPA
ncbi:MAG: DsbA family protein [Alphaproteobacteria bacterium]